MIAMARDRNLARQRGQVTLETALMAPFLLVFFLLVIEAIFLVNSLILVQYAAFAVARCGIVSPYVYDQDGDGTVSFREDVGDEKNRFHEEALGVAATIMSGINKHFTPAGMEEQLLDAVKERCEVNVEPMYGRALKVEVGYNHPILMHIFQRYGAPEGVWVKATAGLPLIRYVPEQ